MLQGRRNAAALLPVRSQPIVNREQDKDDHAAKRPQWMQKSNEKEIGRTLLNCYLFICYRHINHSQAVLLLSISLMYSYSCPHLDTASILAEVVKELFTWLFVWEIDVRKIRKARKRLMQRCKWMVVLGLWMERINENVRMQKKRQSSERESPKDVIICNSKGSCWKKRGHIIKLNINCDNVQ